MGGGHGGGARWWVEMAGSGGVGMEAGAGVQNLPRNAVAFFFMLVWVCLVGRRGDRCGQELRRPGSEAAGESGRRPRGRETRAEGGSEGGIEEERIGEDNKISNH